MQNPPETMIFPLESENQFLKDDVQPVKMAQNQPESPLLTNESTASNILTSSFLKKRKPGKETAPQMDTSAQAASLFEIVSDPKLAYSSTKSRKIRKTEIEPEVIEASTSSGVKKLVLKDGKIEFEAAVETKIQVEVQKRTTSASFKTPNHTEKWTEEETSRFYEGLEIFGSDFSMIGILFPKRTRDQIKKKFTREEKSDGKRVNEALRAHTTRRSIPDKLMETLNISAVVALKPSKIVSENEKPAVVDEINQILCNIVRSNAKK